MKNGELVFFTAFLSVLVLAEAKPILFARLLILSVHNVMIIVIRATAWMMNKKEETMSTKHQFNQRKKALELLKRQMSKKGFEFKKAVRNTVTFYHPETGKKTRETLVY